MTKQTKTIEDYPELKVLKDDLIKAWSLAEFYDSYLAVEQKLLEMQSKIDELTEQNKELGSYKEQACPNFVKAIEYSLKTDCGEDWLNEWLNGATYEELVQWGWDDTPEDIFSGLIELNKESK